jgi:hypothetical protein
MSKSLDWPQAHPLRRGRYLLLIFVILAAIIVVGRAVLSYYVDVLWFGSLGYGDVFWKTLTLKWAVFAAFFVATFIVVYGAFLALKRSCATELPQSHTIYVGGQPVALPVDSVLRVIGPGGALVIAGLTGVGMMESWPTLALYWNAPKAMGSVVDPIFSRPLNFYLFALPAWQLISGWLLSLAVIACVIAVFFILLTGSTRALAGQRDSYIPLPWRGFSIAFAFLLPLLAVRLYISRFEKLFEDHTIFGGVTYVDAHVALSGILIVCAALLLGAVLAAVNAMSVLPRGRQLVVAILPAVVCYLALQVVVWYVGSFIVKPNELVREQPFITNNIAMTRQAYGLDGFVQREFPAETTVEAADAPNNQPTLQNIRLWDWHALQDTLRQIQEIRTYYDFPDIDIDRYEIDGTVRQVMLATRELNVDKLPESSRNWINEKLIYTHGYGITMNPVNGFTSEGLPTLILSNMPVQSTVPSLKVTRPQIYFGELTNTDVYVKTKQKEFDYPQGPSNSVTSYEGSGGIVLGGFLRRMILAFDRGDLAKLPFSDDVNKDSRLLMKRNVRERVATLAPFLTFEKDPYIVLGDDGRLSWIIDAFTVSDTYPYASHYRLPDHGLINYMRNSVKVVIDAYDGTTTFYVFDKNDPIIATYRSIFPSLFKDAAAMPPGLRKHVRYPEMLLKLQAEVYGLYHMTNEGAFYNREDLWTVATEVGMAQGGQQTTQTIQPNFVQMKLPGEAGVEFVEILPFTPANRNNLIGWIAGRSDGEHYGSSVVYNFPKTRLVDGPLQIEARIDQNAQLSGQLSLWNQQGSHVRRGTLLVIPIGKALLYAEPIYLQADRSPMPELRLVVLALQDRLAYGSTFESALTGLFGGAVSSTTASVTSAEPTRAAAASNGKPQPEGDINSLIKEASKNFADYQRLTSEGKLGEAGQKLEQLKQAIEKLNSRQR